MLLASMRVNTPTRNYASAVPFACDSFVQLERVTPEGLTPECLETECLLALIKHCLRVVHDVRIKACLGGRGGKGKHSADGTRAKRCDYCGSNFHVMPPFLKDSVLLTTPFQIYSDRGHRRLRP